MPCLKPLYGRRSALWREKFRLKFYKCLFDFYLLAKFKISLFGAYCFASQARYPSLLITSAMLFAISCGRNSDFLSMTDTSA